MRWRGHGPLYRGWRICIKQIPDDPSPMWAGPQPESPHEDNGNNADKRDESVAGRLVTIVAPWSQGTARVEGSAWSTRRFALFSLLPRRPSVGVQSRTKGHSVQ